MEVYGALGANPNKKVASLERKKRLIDLASDDLKNRFNKIERKTSHAPGRHKPMLTEESEEVSESELNFEESIAAFLEKIDFERKLKTQRKNEDAHSLIIETD